MNRKPSVGILGAGKLGMTIAKLGIDAGYKVYIAGSGSPQKIELATSVLAPGAIPVTSEDAIKNGDFVVLALPLNKYKSIEPKRLKGKIVIDAMNYWWEVDGDRNQYYDENKTSSEAVQEHFAESIVIKAFNHMGYHDLANEAHSMDRKAVALAGNNESINEKIKLIIQDFGFDPYYLGTLDATDHLQPGGALFGVNETEEGIKQILSNQKTNN